MSPIGEVLRFDIVSKVNSSGNAFEDPCAAAGNNGMLASSEDFSV
jgi:hypothetical protein